MNEFANCRFDVRTPDEDSPIGRWGHSSCVLKDEVIFFGGEAEECTEVQNIEPLLILNVNTYKFAQVLHPGGPRSRDSHTFLVVKDKSYVWGGCRNKAVCHDCYCFSGGVWKEVNQKGRKPAARESQAAGVLNNRYILMYGGLRDPQTFNDFHVFDTEDSTWYELNRVEGGPFPIREGATLSVVKGTDAYIFGGRDNNERYCNDLFRLTLENYQFQKRTPPPTLRVEKVDVRGVRPAGRSDHATVVFENNYLIVIGGMMSVEVPGGEPRDELLNDIWTFNLRTDEWEMLQPQNHHLFKKRCNFSAVVYEDDIIIFGGMSYDPKQPNHGDLVTLSLEPASKRLSEEPFQVCGACQSIYTHPKPSESSSMTISRARKNFNVDALQLRSLAMLIGHPFRAFELILDYFRGRKSQQIKFLCSSKNDHRYIRIVSNESVPYLNYELSASLCSYGMVYDCESAEATLRNMKFACLRLSQSFIIINTFGHDQCVVLYANGEIHYYFVNLQNGNIGCSSSPNTIPIIRQHTAPFQFERKFDEGTQEIILLDPPKELLFTADDILLQNGATGGSFEPERWDSHLSDRLSRHFLDEFPLKVLINERAVRFANLKGQMRVEESERSIFLDCPKLPEARIRWSPDTRGNFIGYYQNNKLVGFYSSRLRREYFGYLVVPEEVPLNMFGTDFRSALEKQQIELIVQSTLEQHSNQTRLKRPSLVSIEDLASEAESNQVVKRQHTDP